MSTIEEKIEILLDTLEKVGLDFNWLIAITSLATQEIAVKRKLDELGEFYSEEDFQKLAEKLMRAIERRGERAPHILMSIVRSYRHIRAKIMHDPHKTKISTEEADAIFNNTRALVRRLFEAESGQTNISKFIKSINKSSLSEKVEEFKKLNKTTKKQIFNAIMDKISLLKWNEIKVYEALFDFLLEAMKIESNTNLQIELFEIVIQKTLIGGPSFGKEKLLSIISEMTRLNPIANFIKEKGLIDLIITEFEYSNSFNIAAYNAKILANLAYLLNEKQVNQIIDVALTNNQITYSWGAASHLKKILAINKDKISKEKAEKIRNILRCGS